MNEPEQKPVVQKRRPVALLVVGAILLLTFMVYTQPFGKGNIARVASILPFPVAQVNGGVVMYRRAFQKRNGLKQFYEKDAATLGDDFHERLFESILREKLIRQLMKEHKVFFSETDVAQVMQDAQDQVGSREQFESEIKDTYGWNRRQFERHVARPLVEAQALESVILKDHDLQQQKRALIDEAYTKLQEEAEFDGLVLEYSEDATSIFNGDFGWMTEIDLPKAWLGPALHLDIGETSPVLEEEDRYTILRVDNRREADEDLETPLRVNLSAIIVNKISLSEVVQDFAEQSKIEVFVKL